MSQPQKLEKNWEELSKMRRIVQKIKNIFMPTFCNVTLKIETKKKVVKSILETWNVNDVIVYVWFISGKEN